MRWIRRRERPDAAAGKVVAAPLRRRQWRRRLGAARRYIWAALAVAVLALATYAVVWSPWLATDRVEVEGTTTVAADVVVDAAAVPPGTPLVRVDLDEVDDRVSAIRAVADVAVHRSWPRTITITVTEREPVAALRRDGAWWVIDKDGVLFRKVVRPAPTLTVVDLDEAAGREALREVASVVTALPIHIRTDMLSVQASSMDSIHLLLRGGDEVVWGNADSSERKAAVLAQLRKQPAAVYDVSVPELPTTSS